ncbi:MAG: hypothetical protein M4579_002833 [Chaenotheca gracillima]|nr:MAG: hypothetical protein M4579_002833 [Chaenotheca gracillima]
MATTVDMKLLRQTKFPPEFNQKVDMKKVNLEVMKKWIAGKISEILGSEDDVVIELCFNLLEGSRFPEIKKLQISLTGFLDKDTPKFCKELWNLCLSAQSNPQGVPKELLEAKKLELIQDKIEAEKAAERARHDREQEMNKQREMDTIRQRERGDRRGRGDGRRDGRGGRGFGHQGGRDSRSPPRRRRSPMRGEGRKGPMRRDVDTYIPRGGSKGKEGNRHVGSAHSQGVYRVPLPPIDVADLVMIRLEAGGVEDHIAVITGVAPCLALLLLAHVHPGDPARGCHRARSLAVSHHQGDVKTCDDDRLPDRLRDPYQARQIVVSLVMTGPIEQGVHLLKFLGEIRTSHALMVTRAQGTKDASAARAEIDSANVKKAG